MTISKAISKISSLIDISQQDVLPIVEMALWEIYTYSQNGDPVLWEFMLKREAFQVGSGLISESLQVGVPILEVSSFYCGKIPTEVEFKEGECECIPESCNCPVALPDCKCGCYTIDMCGCETECGEIDLKKRSAKGMLCGDDYQIISGECGFGGFGGQIIKVNLGKERCKCGGDGLWVEYYGAFNEITCLDNKFPLPRSFMLAFLHIFQSLLVMKTDPELSAVMYTRFISKMKTLSNFEGNTLYSIKYGNKD